jgi:pimeloyl-ACP methyl ester carboxylesterase
MKKMKAADIILLILAAASLAGCVAEFQRRYRLLYFCIPLFFFIFFLLERRIKAEKGKIIKMAALFVGVLLAIYCSIVFYLSSTPIAYVRDPQSEMYLEKIDFFEQLSIPSMNGKTDGWLYKQSDEKAPLIIFFNGAGECSAKIARKFHEEGILDRYFPGYNFLSTDYPSYGISDGYVSEAAMKKMALDTYDTAIQWDFVDKSNITVMGYSIGTGPASYLAAHRDLTFLVLLAPYEDFYDNRVRNIEMLNRRKDYGKSFECLVYGLLWGYNVDPVRYAGDIDEPVMIISSRDDRTIIYEASMKVADRIDNCEVVTLEGVKHEDLLGDTSYEAISRFLQR